MGAANRRGPRPTIRPGASTTAVLRGEVDLEDWDDEEIKRGRRRNKHGTFNGRPPSVIPRQVYDELRRRTAQDFEEMVRQELLPVTEVIIEMAKGERPADPTQLKAAQEIVNRYAGKPPENINLSGTVTQKPWERAIEAGIVRDADSDDGEVIDAEVVDDGDQPWDDDE